MRYQVKDHYNLRDAVALLPAQTEYSQVTFSRCQLSYGEVRNAVPIVFPPLNSLS